MSYGRNFGMRSFENIVRDGRFRVPATGTALRIGEGVMVDVATPGRLKQATNGVAPTQLCGIVVFEHIQNKSDALVTNHDDPYDKVPLGVYAQFIHGPGAKVWFKNTPLVTLYDGRQRPLFDFVTLAGLIVGDGISPNGSGIWVEDASAPWLTVEQIDTDLGLVEARFNF
jgi:hypothetical protein